MQELGAEYCGEKLSIEEIRNLCLVIEAEYAKRGYFLARAFPPVQKVKSGVLIIQIMEGKLGEVVVEGNRYYSAGFIRSYLERFIGKAIQYEDLLKALFLINENKKLRVGGLLAKGKVVGTADLIVTVKDEWPASLYLDCNNYGSLQTATWRSGGRFEVGNLLAQGDVLSMAGVLGLPVDRLQFTDLIYKIPVTRRGTILSLSYLFAHFKLGVFKDLDLGGMSNIWTGKVSQAIWRTRSWSSDVYGAFDIKQVQNTSHGYTTSNDRLRILSGGFRFDVIDPLKGLETLPFPARSMELEAV